jgi:copper homeostasis protein
MKLEACVNSAVSALEAQKGGADRVELCENLPEGGCTPSAGTIQQARKYLHIGLFVMIRPRGADFLYTDTEFEIMKQDILIAKTLGADGVVFGILKPDGTIDKERMKLLTDLSRPMKITCHRAFDMTADPFFALEELVALGVDRILTSGQQNSAMEGVALIRSLRERASGRIIIMPGGGVKEHNIVELIKETGVTEVHVHLEKQEQSRMQFLQPAVTMGKSGRPEYSITVTDAERIRKITGLIK